MKVYLLWIDCGGFDDHHVDLFGIYDYNPEKERKTIVRVGNKIKSLRNEWFRRYAPSSNESDEVDRIYDEFLSLSEKHNISEDYNSCFIEEKEVIAKP